MIISNNSNPDTSLYVRGAELLQVLRSEQIETHDLFALFHKVNEKLKRQLSFNQYLFTLDWLFMLGFVDLTNEGNIRTCN